MRVGFGTSPQQVDWPTLETAWAEAGRHEVFDSGWLTTTSAIRPSSRVDGATTDRRRFAPVILLTTLARDGARGIRRLATEVAAPIREAFG